jgi:hypothetical protein
LPKLILKEENSTKRAATEANATAKAAAQLRDQRLED